MSPLIGFLLFIVCITVFFTVYTYKSLRDPNEVTHKIKPNGNKKFKNFWLKTEITNSRLALFVFIILLISYGISESLITNSI